MVQNPTNRQNRRKTAAVTYREARQEKEAPSSPRRFSPATYFAISKRTAPTPILKNRSPERVPTSKRLYKRADTKRHQLMIRVVFVSKKPAHKKNRAVKNVPQKRSRDICRIQERLVKSPVAAPVKEAHTKAHASMANRSVMPNPFS